MHTQLIEQLIEQIRIFPSQLEAALNKIDNSKLDAPIREGAWTIRQSINHLVDSLVNSYIRVKFAIAENNPTIMTYNEEKWAEIFDTRDMDISPTLPIIRGFHDRIVYLLEKLDPQDWKRTLYHPEAGQMTLTEYVKVTKSLEFSNTSLK
ncbi:MAG: DinB family protein [Candidatus Kariarchaeaceae archaeon]|jgi:hypothetical protein